MWIKETYVNVKNIVVVEPYIMDRSYGLKINGIPVEIDNSIKVYSVEEKDEISKEIRSFIEGEIIQGE